MTLRVRAAVFGVGAVVVAGCGRIDFDDRTTSDARGPIDTATDGLSARDCWPQWRAGTARLNPPTLVPNLGPASGDPSLTADGLTMYFAGGAATMDVSVTTRADLASPWGPASIVTELDTGMESRVTLSGDGLIVIMSSYRAGGQGNADLWMATRASVSDPFATPTEMYLGNVDDNTYQLDPFLSLDGLRLYESPASGSQQLAFASRPDLTSSFSSATLIPNVNISGSVGDPALSPDELVFSFSSEPASDDDLYYAARPDLGSDFVNVQPITDINTPQNEGDGDFSPDGCELYFMSDRIGGVHNIFVATVI